MIVHAAFVFFSSFGAALHTSQRAPPQDADDEFAAAMRQYIEEQEAITEALNPGRRQRVPPHVDENTCVGKKFQYLAPPHCATTTVGNAIWEAMHRMKAVGKQTHCAFELNGHAHNRPDKQKQLGCCATGLPKHRVCTPCVLPLSVTFIRDPWKRLLTCAGYIGRGKTFDGLSTNASKIIAFREFVRDDSKMEQCKEWMHSQVDWVVPGQTYIFRISHLEEDFQRLCELIGVSKEYCPAPKTVHRVTSDRGGPDFSDYYDQEAIRAVARHWADDIEYFGFKFGEDGERWGLAT